MRRRLTSEQEEFLIEYVEDFVANNVVSSMARRLWDRYSANRDLDGRWHTATDPRIREIINAIYDRAWRNMTDSQIEKLEELGGYRIDPAGETRYFRRNPRDACYRKVKSRYKVWPSAYASGALVQCRKVGAANWGVRGNPRFDLEKKYGLRGWFMRGGGKGWVDCKTGKTCGRQAGEKRKYPACRPTLAMCTSAARKKKGRKRISWNPVPPKKVAAVACRGLAKRKKYRRGGTSVGVARARDLCNRRNLSKQTLARMRSYFARHRASKAESAKRRSDPTSAAAIADDLWGGTAGMKWANLLR
jgi:hypothetical protein